jgi:cytochrome c oxidase cbb3-type subunit 4
MDITTMRIVATLASLACFVGIWWWAYARRNRPFDEAAQLPFAKTMMLHQREQPMSDFTNNFWSVYVAGITLAASSPVPCCCGCSPQEGRSSATTPRATSGTRTCVR